MSHHVIVDGSNLATEGRTLPSLKQLNEAVAAYRDDHADALITVVVDATFGHRIDPKEVPEFERAIETNAFVAPPAGAVGRGDGFILSIAQKANASILSNDSYQEFHGEYAWLFDEGRLIGGKPVPHVGWVFVNRVPVRGPISRRSVKEQKIVDKSPSRGRGRKSASTESMPSISADGPMPIPKMPPPGASMSTPQPAGHRQPREAREPREPRQPRQSAAQASQPSASNGDRGATTAAKSTNDLLAFLGFVEHYPVGTAVTAVVESYSSHGAYVAIGDAKGYVPLRLMAEPAPRSAREVMAIGETVTLVVHSFGAARRSIDLAVPAMAPPAPAVAPPKARRSTSKAAKQAAPGNATLLEAGSVAAEAIAAEAVESATAGELEAIVATKPARGRGATKKAAASRGARAAAAASTGGDESSLTFDTAFETAPEAIEAPAPTPAQPAKPAKSAGRKRSAKADTATSSVAPEPAASAPEPETPPVAGSTPATRGRATRKAAAKAAVPTSTPTSTSTGTAADQPQSTTATKSARRPRAAAATKQATAPEHSAAPAEAATAAPAKQAAKRARSTTSTRAAASPSPDATAAAATSEPTATADATARPPAKRSGGGRRRPPTTSGGS